MICHSTMFLLLYRAGPMLNNQTKLHVLQLRLQGCEQNAKGVKEDWKYRENWPCQTLLKDANRRHQDIYCYVKSSWVGRTISANLLLVIIGSDPWIRPSESTSLLSWQWLYLLHQTVSADVSGAIWRLWSWWVSALVCECCFQLCNDEPKFLEWGLILREKV